jgi:hypothetical protein
MGKSEGRMKGGVRDGKGSRAVEKKGVRDQQREEGRRE